MLRAFAAWRSCLAEVVDHYWRPVRKPRNEFERAAHAFGIVPQRREQHVAAFFQQRNCVLTDTEFGSQLHLRFLDGQAQVFSVANSCVRFSIRFRRLAGRAAITSSSFLAMGASGVRVLRSVTRRSSYRVSAGTPGHSGAGQDEFT